MPVVSNDFSDIVYNRRSIRNFDPSVKIPREELLEILDKLSQHHHQLTCNLGVLSSLIAKRARKN